MADGREVNFGPQKSTWQVRSVTIGSQGFIYLGLIQKCCFTTAKETTELTPIKPRRGSSIAEAPVTTLLPSLTQTQWCSDSHRHDSLPCSNGGTVTVCAQRGCLGHRLAPAPRAPRLCAGTGAISAPPGLLSAPALNGLHYQHQRRSIHFLSPARGIFAFKLENNLLFFALASYFKTNTSGTQ